MIASTYWVKDLLKKAFKKSNKYSTTEEIKIGEWVDGKPIYRKVIDFGNLPNATTKTLAHGIQNLDRITRIDGIVRTTTSDDGYYPINFPHTTDAKSCWQCVVSGANIVIVTGTNRSSLTGLVFLEYTKTTD